MQGAQLSGGDLRGVQIERAGGATGADAFQGGDADAGRRWCEEALALSPIPFDAANIKAVKGYGLMKAGQTEAGIAELSEALA